MNKLVLVSLGTALLAGCVNDPVIEWQQSNHAIVAEAKVTLKSNLWLNKMPAIGQAQDNTIHGALYLESDGALPAELGVESVTLQQGEESWEVDAEQVELRTHNPEQWEVAFAWQFPIDLEKPVDVALKLDNNGQVSWLIEKDVTIDTVY
ncbi:DNA polymerase III subunit beta [Vibrio tubiashii]|nr:DNA polymerase III subunit beta [Vibrio tubiashii]